MSDDLTELAACLGTPVPGLFLLRYRSALVLDDLIARLRLQLGARPLHEVRYDPRAADQEQGSPSALTDRCRALADATIPVLFLRPEPGDVAEAAVATVANFWKQLNSRREPLGDLSAQTVLCLDLAQTPFAFSHAKDLISWCSPKFEFLALTPTPAGEKVTLQGETRRDAAGASALLTWQSLQPLWQKVVASGQPPTPEDGHRLLIPLLRSAVDLGMVSQGSRLIREAAHATFRTEFERVSWLNLCGDLAAVQGDLDEALRSFTESKTVLERLTATNPANATWQFNLGIVNERLGALAVQHGKFDEALVFLTRRHDIISALAASDPANAEWQRDLSVSLEKRGDLAVAQGDLAGALRCFSESKTIRERLAASDPANAEWQRDLSVSLNYLGNLAVAQGDLAGALRCFSESKTIAERLAASDPANAAWQRDLSVSLDRLGDLAVAQGDLAGALRYFTESKTIAERLAASDPANAMWQRDLWVTYWKLTKHCEESGRPDEAKAWWRKAHDTLAGMKQRGLHISPEDEDFLARLRAKEQ
jgi:tetratricopeptide (TPR) repeat protein